MTIDINKSPVAATTSVLSNDIIAIKFIILIFSQNFTELGAMRKWGGGGMELIHLFQPFTNVSSCFTLLHSSHVK